MRGCWGCSPAGSAAVRTSIAASGKGPEGSINFVTCHDGFTLNDLVSYRAKHNEANGEANRDGTDANFSENFGAEGVTSDIADRGAAQAADQEFPADAIHLARRADAARRRRVPSHSGRK